MVLEISARPLANEQLNEVTIPVAQAGCLACNKPEIEEEILLAVVEFLVASRVDECAAAH